MRNFTLKEKFNTHYSNQLEIIPLCLKVAPVPEHTGQTHSGIFPVVKELLVLFFIDCPVTDQRKCLSLPIYLCDTL